MSAQAAAQTMEAAKLDAAIDAALAEERLVGGVVTVSRQGEPAYERAFGLADREAETPVTRETIFRLASVTKPVVCVAALRLIEQDEMSLDDPVHEWLPDFHPVGPDGEPATILIRHLLTHTSGLRYEDTRHNGVSTGLDAPGRDGRENLARLAAIPLAFRPGSSWAYGMSIDVLGAVVQKVTRGTLEEAVRAQVLEPLGLPDDAFVFSLPQGTPVAVPYVNDDPRPHRMDGEETVGAVDGEGGTTYDPSRIFDPTSFQAGGAGAASTAPVIHAVLEAMRADAADGGGRLLSREMAVRQFATQTGDLMTEPGSGFSYTGAVVFDPGRTKLPFSPGTLRWGGVYGHTWFIDPVAGLTVTIVTNTIFEGVNGKVTVDIRDALYPAR